MRGSWAARGIPGLKTLKHWFRRGLLRAGGVRATAHCPVETIRGWTLCTQLLGPESVVYSVGIGRHIRFDLELIERFRLTVHGFDPTPVSVAWIRGQDLSDAFVFHEYGVAAYDGAARFYAPRRDGSAHFSTVERDRDAEKRDMVEGPVFRIATIAQRLDHGKIDVLKMDIEGAEYEVIDDFVRGPVEVDQFLVEFHHNYPSIPLTRTLRAVRTLREAGLFPAHISRRGMEMLFVHERALRGISDRSPANSRSPGS